MMSMDHRAARSLRRCQAAAVAAIHTIVGLAGASGQALAQDCTLGVRATPNVIETGQIARVEVLATFPSTFYAFASAQFNVRATHPAWSFASAGLFAGQDVIGINVWQHHAPQSGVFAIASNPYRVWRGVFTPDTNEPALVEITSDPSTIALYPHRLTSSWIPGEARGDSDWVLVNPVGVGKWLAAPDRGTRIRIGDDVIVDGRIITGENPAGSPRIGLLLPAIQKVMESAMTIRLGDRPDALAVTVDLPTVAGEQLSLNYTKVDWSSAGDAGVYGLSADLAGSEQTPVRFEAFRNGVRVAEGTLDDERSPLWVDRVPDQVTTSIRPIDQRGELEPYRTITLESTLVSSWSTTSHGSARLFGVNGLAIEVDRVTLSASRPISANNIRQMGLGCHVIEASGVPSLSVTPVQPRR